MYLEIEFEEQDNSFDLEFEQVTEISDGGFDRGYAEGYENGKGDGLTEGYAKGETDGFADALAKRTELVVTDSGEYVPEGESTGFKKVTVGIQKGEDLDAVIAEQAELIGELSATLDEKIGAYDVGYDAALEKLTDLVATENGEYKPSEGSTGFKSVSVNVQAKSDIDALIERSITEVNSGATGDVGKYMFYNCKALVGANFPNATGIGDYAFQSCSALVSANIPNATSVGSEAFYGCSALVSVNIQKATSIGDYAFQSCSALKSANFPQATKCGMRAFNGCSALETLDLPNATGISTYTFENCNKLANVNIPKVTSLGTALFKNCRALTSIDLPSVKSIGYSVFVDCRRIKSVILRYEKVCTLQDAGSFENCTHILGTVDSYFNPNGDQDGYFYVPRALVESYKTATNWSTYASQIRALEDYTVDGTINGALDPNKI